MRKITIMFFFIISLNKSFKLLSFQISKNIYFNNHSVSRTSFDIFVIQ